MKAIILYCSRTGNTENLVHRICRTIPADTLKVEPREPYGSYISSVLRVRKERKNNIIPEALTPAPDLAGYDLVFVGFPIWFNDIPAFSAVSCYAVIYGKRRLSLSPHRQTVRF